MKRLAIVLVAAMLGFATPLYAADKDAKMAAKPAATAAQADDKIDINRAKADQLMTLEGIGIVTDPGFSFFDTAKPYAKEFMLKREGRVFGKLILDKITGRENAACRIEWSKVWKLRKMAARMYLEG